MVLNRRLLWASLTSACLLVGACDSEPPVTEGRVLNRNFEPAHEEEYWRTEYRTEYYTEEVCTSDYDPFTGEYRGQRCRQESRTRQVPYDVRDTRWVPDDWDLYLQQCEPEGTRNEDGEILTTDERCREGWVDIDDEDTYDSYEIGSYYP